MMELMPLRAHIYAFFHAPAPSSSSCWALSGKEPAWGEPALLFGHLPMDILWAVSHCAGAVRPQPWPGFGGDAGIGETVSPAWHSSVPSQCLNNKLFPHPWLP